MSILRLCQSIISGWDEVGDMVKTNNMTPKEKAKELIDKFYEHSYNPTPFADTFVSEGYHARQISIICIDEIIKSKYGSPTTRDVNFWKAVKEEIEK